MTWILYTRHDGGVAVCMPSARVLTGMRCGGLYPSAPVGWIKEQEERRIASGQSSYAARRLVRALAFGGCTTSDALEIIRDTDCAPHGTAFEVVDQGDIPADRWFRDAWRRSHNGGPIYIDIGAAQKQQWRHIATRIERERMVRRLALDADGLRIDEADLKRRIRSATHLHELRAIWPFDEGDTWNG